jgi:hypothetical protein
MVGRLQITRQPGDIEPRGIVNAAEANHHAPHGALLAAIPFLFGAAGMLLNGYVVDSLVRRGFNAVKTRKVQQHPRRTKQERNRRQQAGTFQIQMVGRLQITRQSTICRRAASPRVKSRSASKSGAACLSSAPCGA